MATAGAGRRCTCATGRKTPNQECRRAQVSDGGAPQVSAITAARHNDDFQIEPGGACDSRVVAERGGADRRKRVEIADVLAAYVAACKSRGAEVAGVEIFGA
jgi:hypothetical protein